MNRESIVINNLELAYYTNNVLSKNSIVLIQGNSTCRNSFKQRFPANQIGQGWLMELGLIGHDQSEWAHDLENDLFWRAWGSETILVCQDNSVKNKTQSDCTLTVIMKVMYSKASTVANSSSLLILN